MTAGADISRRLCALRDTEYAAFQAKRTPTIAPERISLMPSWRPWSTSELASLRDMVAGGATYARVAEALGRTRHSVTSAAHRFGCGANGHQVAWTPELESRAVAMRLGGASYKAVALAVGKSERFVAAAVASAMARRQAEEVR